MSDATYLYANQVHFKFGLCKLNICVVYVDVVSRIPKRFIFINVLCT